MRRGLAAASLSLALLAAGSARAESGTWLRPAWLRAQVAAQGAKAVVDRLWRRHRWEELATQIDAGATRWVALAPLLAPGTDAGTAEELGIALAAALPKNPHAVLGVLAEAPMPLSPEVVCGAPFIEDTVKDVAAYLRRATAAVQRIKAPALHKAKTACLAALRDAARRPP